MRDVQEAVLLVLQGGVILHRDHAGVPPANSEKIVLVLRSIEGRDRVSTKQGERVLLAQVVPKLLQLDRSLELSFRPQDGDHLSEDRDAAPAAIGSRRSASDD